jgi:hypothetical protein
MVKHSHALLLILTVALGPLMWSHGPFEDASMTINAIKFAGIAVLSLSQWIGVSLHPFIGTHSWATVGEHLLLALSVAHVLVQNGYMLGYPVLPGTSLVSSFAVPCAVFASYIVLGASLVRNGWSRQWANLAYLAVLLVGDMHGWHPNPIIIAVSIYTYGFHDVYALHLLAIAVAVLVATRINKRLGPSPKTTYELSYDTVIRLIRALERRHARIAKSPKK